MFFEFGVPRPATAYSRLVRKALRLFVFAICEFAMPTAVQNLIVLGDSLSDVGNKREAPTGLFARALKAMRTNEIGRFSDGKNWTDFLVEWTGADPLVRGDKDATDSATLPPRTQTTRTKLLKTDTNAK
ncbi:hypothetical protein, partial [Nocardia brasiliensis]|uniref:hypothetical protein n=1 Tax=Nocardia brasiliensis TaxID=37326 RepID=UPI0024542A28